MKRVSFGLNPVALIANGLLIAAMYYPWWSFKLAIMEQTDVYPYLIDGPASEFIGYTRSSMMELLTGVLIICIVLVFIGTFIKSKATRIMLGISGTLILLASWRLLVRVTGVAAAFDMPVQGNAIATYGGFADLEVWTWIQPGLYLAGAAGVLVLIATLFYKKTFWTR
jgi:hypothetical protein